MRTAPVALPIALFLSLALAACGGDDQAGGDRPPPEAGFITVEPEPFTITSELPGRTTPHQVAEVRPQVNGIIEERLFEEGQLVEKASRSTASTTASTRRMWRAPGPSWRAPRRP